MATSPLLRAIAGFIGSPRIVESMVPRRTFDDVILPPATRRALDRAIGQVTKHDPIFNRWGLGQRHPMGMGLAFHFAGPPVPGRPSAQRPSRTRSSAAGSLIVRYAEVESMWMGETPKNVAALFLQLARDENAVLLFDEADAIASRRSTSTEQQGPSGSRIPWSTYCSRSSNRSEGSSSFADQPRRELRPRI